jgi:chromosome segregation ATPase
LGGCGSNGADWQRRYEDLEERLEIAIRELKRLNKELGKADIEIENLRKSLREVRSDLADEKRRGDLLEEERNQLLRRIDELLEQLARTERERDGHNVCAERLEEESALTNGVRDLPPITPNSSSRSIQGHSDLTSQETGDSVSSRSQQSQSVKKKTLLTLEEVTKEGSTSKRWVRHK